MDVVCAVLDVGKTNTKAGLVNARGEIVRLESRRTPGRLRDGLAAFDVDEIFEWFCDRLASFAGDFAIDRIIPVAHGAAAAMLDQDGRLVFPVNDYENPIPGPIDTAYMQARPDFSETGSPALPLGLNLGRQLFWASRSDPECFARVRHILPYAQYWAFRLSGQLASEASSLGCHTDMWRPDENAPSSLCVREGWAAKIPPLAKAWETVGMLRPEIAQRTGLSASCAVHAGVHDTNAALFSTIAGGGASAVLSTGTWFIAMNPGGSVAGLDPARDCLANIDVLGRPTPCARFMGGRENEAISAGAAAPDDIDEAIDTIVRNISSPCRPSPTRADRSGEKQANSST